MVLMTTQRRRKNPHAVALGRKGGQKTGVRKGFAALTPEQRSAIARKGGQAGGRGRK